MTINWLQRLLSKNSSGGGASNTQRGWQTQSQRLNALARYYQSKAGGRGASVADVRAYDMSRQPQAINPRLRGLAAVRAYDVARPPVVDLGGGRYGYNMTYPEYLRVIEARQMLGLPTFQPTQQEWILRQNSAPIGKVWTPYAGWVDASEFARQAGINVAPQQPATASQSGGYYGGYGYGSGGGGGGGSSGSLPSWYEHFLNQVTWRI